MKSVAKISMLIGVLFFFSLCEANAQIAPDSSVVNKEYDDLEEALKNPNNVYRLNLSNQNFTSLSDSIWIKFENLEYLSLENDHLEEIPFGIGNLKNLKVLDLSNNDFEVLPKSFSRLKNLREIYLNGEKKMDINQALRTIRNLPNLKILHLENDNLESIPQSLLRLTHLETLYLNNNKFSEIPIELRKLKNLNYLDFHGNKFRINNPDFQLQYQGSGIILNF